MAAAVCLMRMSRLASQYNSKNIYQRRGARLRDASGQEARRELERGWWWQRGEVVLRVGEGLGEPAP